MATVRWTSTLERVLVEDVRGNDAFMRVTLHETAAALDTSSTAASSA